MTDTTDLQTRDTMTPERQAWRAPGLPMFAVVIAMKVIAVGLIVLSAAEDTAAPGVIGALVLVVAVVMLFGFFINQPNQARVLTFFGRYIGTVRDDGWWWVTPFTIKQRLSLRIRNFDSDVLKVNDAVGNPIEISSIVNWQVFDTGRATFDVDNYANFVALQAEAAVRHVASAYPYDDYDEGQQSLRANADEVTATLQQELQQRLQVAGVTILDTRLRRLAYAPEIAGEMLRRQQANAVVAARQRIVEGAVGMVEHALEMLSQRQVVDLDEERKASMVSNLLVVLCSDRGAQPVVNSGSLY
jgi:regulator of protease activity HflC (stomatin/prohibitin superfamily)